MSRLKDKHLKEVVPAMMEQFGFKNIMQVPKVTKIVVNMGVGDAILDPKLLDAAVNDLALITGQRPLVTKAKKSIASFKIREGMSIGCKVTLRGETMYSFLDKLINAVLPRVRDFSGVSPKSFDGRGNYALGLKEQLIFPEIDYDKVVKIRGMDIIIVTSSDNDDQARALLAKMGMPFKES